MFLYLSLAVSDKYLSIYRHTLGCSLPAVVSTVGTSIVTKRIGKSQRVWAGATQRRIATTSSMLQDMKSVKIMGLSQVLGDIVQGERVAETNKMESWAWIIVWQNVIGNVQTLSA